MSEITLTLAMTTTGQSESIAVAADTTTLIELADFAMALLGIQDTRGDLALLKDGRRLSPPSLTLQQAGLVHGDVIAVEVVSAPNTTTTTRAAAPAPAAASAASSGGLDFSNLFSSTAAAAAAPSNPSAVAALPPSTHLYIPGMSLAEATQYNPHPQSIVTLLRTHSHLMKELNHHNPILAQKLQASPSLEMAVTIWREDLVKSGIQAAFKQTQQYQEEIKWRSRLAQNPNDAEANSYFAEQERLNQVNDQYRQVMQEYPESAVGEILMLYVRAKINDHDIMGFVDSGAQQTIMSQKCAERCGLSPWIDKRFSGFAVGVGTGKILGRLHVVQIQIGQTYFPCSVTVMEDGGLGDKNMEFLLGLDMLKRHLCQIDLAKGVLRFTSLNLETPFLHEKDLPQSKGGTIGFDPEKANQEFQKRMEKGGDGNDSNDDNNMDE